MCGGVRVSGGFLAQFMRFCINWDKPDFPVHGFVGVFIAFIMSCQFYSAFQRNIKLELKPTNRRKTEIGNGKKANFAARLAGATFRPARE